MNKVEARKQDKKSFASHIDTIACFGLSTPLKGDGEYFISLKFQRPVASYSAHGAPITVLNRHDGCNRDLNFGSWGHKRLDISVLSYDSDGDVRSTTQGYCTLCSTNEPGTRG